MPTADFSKGGATWNVNVARGDDIAITWEVFDENGNPFVWTGASISAAIVGASSNWTVNATVSGLLTLSVSDAQTQAFGVTTFPQYLRVTKGGVTSTWLAGQFTVRAATDPAVQSPTSRVIRVTTAQGGTLILQGCVGSGGGGGSGSPTGAAGGVLSGTYPAPTFAVDMATQDELNAAVDALESAIAAVSASSGIDVVELSTASYDALADEAPDTIYVLGAATGTTDDATFVEVTTATYDGLADEAPDTLYILTG